MTYSTETGEITLKFSGNWSKLQSRTTKSIGNLPFNNPTLPFKNRNCQTASAAAIFGRKMAFVFLLFV
jgi:hypothetical protein